MSRDFILLLRQSEYGTIKNSDFCVEGYMLVVVVVVVLAVCLIPGQ